MTKPFTSQDAETLRDAVEILIDHHACGEYYCLLSTADQIDASLVPDLVFPKNEQKEGGKPLAFAFYLDGVEYQAVNWWNFKGFEVRRRVKSGAGDPANTVGYVVPHASAGGSRASKTGLLPDERTFDRIDNAIRWLDGRPAK